jgi:hypothetical protein
LIGAKIETSELKKEYLLEDKIYQDKLSVSEFQINERTKISFKKKGINKKIQIHSTYTR